MRKRRWLIATVVVLSAVAVPVALSDPGGGEKAPGSKFKFYGTAQNGQDPQNQWNDVVSVDTTGGKVGGLQRKIGDHVKVESLTNELELKYYLVGRTCGGGSPRLSIQISRDGTDKNTGEIFGYVGPSGIFGGGCPMGQWTYQDLSQTPSWDLTQFGGGYGNTWAQVVTFFDTTYPNHRVVAGYLDDDSSGFFAGDAGCAYYDLVSVGARTYTSHEDADGKGDNAKNNTCP